MVLPFIAATMRDVFDTVPAMLKESGYGLGATTWEVIWNVVVPHSRVGIVGGIMLGLGRALGETMAVTFVIGNAHRISSSLLAPGTTISVGDRQRIHRSGGRPVHLLADRARAAAVPDHLHGDRGGAGCMLLRLERRGAVLGMSRRALRKLNNGAVPGAVADSPPLIGLACLAAILWTLISHGLAGMSWRMFTQMTPPPGGSGGLLNAIYGSAVMTLLGILIGSPDRRAGRHLSGRIRPQLAPQHA